MASTRQRNRRHLRRLTRSSMRLLGRGHRPPAVDGLAQVGDAIEHLLDLAPRLYPYGNVCV